MGRYEEDAVRYIEMMDIYYKDYYDLAFKANNVIESDDIKAHKDMIERMSDKYKALLFVYLRAELRNVCLRKTIDDTIETLKSYASKDSNGTDEEYDWDDTGFYDEDGNYIEYDSHEVLKEGEKNEL